MKRLTIKQWALAILVSLLITASLWALAMTYRIYLRAFSVVAVHQEDRSVIEGLHTVATNAFFVALVSGLVLGICVPLAFRWVRKKRREKLGTTDGRSSAPLDNTKNIEEPTRGRSAASINALFTVLSFGFAFFGLVVLLMTVQTLMVMQWTPLDATLSFLLPMLFEIWYGCAAIGYSVAYLRSRTKRRAHSLATLSGITAWGIANGGVGVLIAQGFTRFDMNTTDPAQATRFWWFALAGICGLFLAVLMGTSTTAVLKRRINAAFSDHDDEHDVPPIDAPRVAGSANHLHQTASDG